jgi:hypothetical protein
MNDVTINGHLGFETNHTLPADHPDDHVVIWANDKQQIRLTSPSYYGEKIVLASVINGLALYTNDQGNWYPVGGGWPGARTKRINHLVYLSGALRRTSGNETLIGEVLDRPNDKQMVTAFAYDGGSWHLCMVQIDTNGELTLINGPSGAIDPLFFNALYDSDE